MIYLPPGDDILGHLAVASLLLTLEISFVKVYDNEIV